VVGARPQFIKAAALDWSIEAWNARSDAVVFDEVLVHTGQHYDYELSQLFFEELNIPKPAVNLDVKSGSHAAQTSKIMVGLESILETERPDWVIVFGDTNSTLAAALAAAKLKIPIAHVEAGLREHNRRIPEEINKIVADHLADLCFAPTPTAMEILEREGLSDRSILVGDIMLDTTVRMLGQLSDEAVARTLDAYGVQKNGYALATTHRAVIRESSALLRNVLQAFRTLPFPVILPLHPSTRSAIEQHGLGDLLASGTSLKPIAPVRYSDMLVLLSNCRVVLSDSGGLIKEAYYFRKPCVTLDYQTEWVETLAGGWNVIAGPDTERIIAAAMGEAPDPRRHRRDVFGSGQTAPRILESLGCGGRAHGFL
jgi:UDP-GlcNAc3NAcA epimerase